VEPRKEEEEEGTDYPGVSDEPLALLEGAEGIHFECHQFRRPSIV
jgi:hypothetical protein